MSETKNYEEGKDDGITNTILYYFGLAIGQLNGMGFSRDELKAQVDSCMDAIEAADPQEYDDVRASVARMVENAKDRQQ